MFGCACFFTITLLVNASGIEAWKSQHFTGVHVTCPTKWYVVDDSVLLAKRKNGRWITAILTMPPYPGPFSQEVILTYCWPASIAQIGATTIPVIYTTSDPLVMY